MKIDRIVRDGLEYGNGLLLSMNKNGYEEYKLNWKKHVEDGPAIIHPNGSEYYYLNGKRHREDRPAIIHPNGSEYHYLNGVKQE